MFDSSGSSQVQYLKVRVVLKVCCEESNGFEYYCIINYGSTANRGIIGTRIVKVDCEEVGLAKCMPIAKVRSANCIKLSFPLHQLSETRVPRHCRPWTV